MRALSCVTGEVVWCLIFMGNGLSHVVDMASHAGDTVRHPMPYTDDNVFLEQNRLYLQEDEAFEVVPRSEFSVSRTALRSNKSDYYINDRKSNFTEVGWRCRCCEMLQPLNRQMFWQVHH